MTAPAPMTAETAAWIRATAWTSRMRKTFETTPGHYTTCSCQSGRTTWCETGKHDRCHRSTPQRTAATVVCRRGGEYPAHFPVPYAHRTDVSATGPAYETAALVWLADRVCRWVCPCDCHPEGSVPVTNLAPAEVTTLAECEGVIERGLATFVKVGTALLKIRDGRLYRTGHDTFESYCRDRWGISDSRARQLIGAAQTVTTVTAEGLPAPATERQARELVPIPEGQRAEVWRETLERTEGRPTAAAIRETTAYRRVARLILEHAYNGERADDWLGDVAVAAPGEVTPELLDAAVAYLHARGISYPGVAEAAERLRPEPTSAKPVPRFSRPLEQTVPPPDTGTWYGGPPEPDPVPLPDRQDEADAAVSRFDRAAADAEPRQEPAAPSPAAVDYIAADPAWQDKAYLASFAKTLTRSDDFMQFDPGRLGRIAGEEIAAGLEDYLAGVERFVSAFRQARTGLRVIEGGK